MTHHSFGQCASYIVAGAAAACLTVACSEPISTPTPSQTATPSPVTTPTPAPNRAPTITSVTTSPDGVALVAATSMTFSGTATDPDGDALTYDWNFGDGTAPVTGASVEHLFGNAGVFQVTLTASDGHGASASSNTLVNAITVTGHWTGCALSGTGVQAFDMTQSGASVSGTYHVPTLTVPFTGVVMNQRLLVLTIFDGQHPVFVLDAAGGSMSWGGPSCTITRDARRG